MREDASRSQAHGQRRERRRKRRLRGQEEGDDRKK